MSKEALMKKMESIKAQYDSQINSLDGKTLLKPKSAKGNRKLSSNKSNKNQLQIEAEMQLNSENSDSNLDSNDPEQRLKKLQQMVVGGELANDEELKKKRNKKKKYAEERKKLADSLKKDDDDFMLRVYDNVQEEVQYKTNLLEKEKQQVAFLQNEVKDLQHEFELEREEYLDTIRKQERQMKLLFKLTQKIQPMIPHDCNYYNLDKIQCMAIWNEELQDWILPDIKRDKISLPTMNGGSKENSNLDMNNNEDFDDLIDSGVPVNYAHNQPVHVSAQLQEHYQQQQQQQQHQQYMLLNGQRQSLLDVQPPPSFQAIREPEIDRYRIKLENSQFDGSNYFKTKRQSELLSQTQDMKTNGRLSPLNNARNGGGRKYY